MTTETLIERPILFSAPMVRAILAGNKTVTRRLSDRWAKVKPGTRLYVRETWRDSYRRTPTNPGCSYLADYGFRNDLVSYEQAKFSWKWKPSIHMPKWASRIWLEVVNVRRERLQEITPLDALAEGFELPVPVGCIPEMANFPDGFEVWDANKQNEWFKGTARAVYFARCADAQDHIDEFRKLWDQINSAPGQRWQDNPEVFRIEFKKIDR